MQQRDTYGNQRQEMVLYASEHGITPAAQKFNTSTKTVAKWLKRYQTLGLAGLQDVVRILPAHPHCKITPTQLNDAVLLKQSQPEITAREIMDKLNFNCSESLLNRKLRSALNSGDGFYDKNLSRMLKNQNGENLYYLFTKIIRKNRSSFFITGAIELKTGTIHLCYGQEEPGLAFNLFVDYLLFHFENSAQQLNNLLLISGPSGDNLFVKRILAKHAFDNLITQKRAAEYLKRHCSVAFLKLAELIQDFDSFSITENSESALIAILLKRSIKCPGQKMLYPINLDNYLSDAEIIASEKDYWRRVNIFSTALNNQIFMLEEQKKHWLEKSQFEEALKSIEEILLLKDSFSLELNSASDLLLKKAALLKSLNRMDETEEVFEELFLLTDPADRIKYLNNLIEQINFYATINRLARAEELLAETSAEIISLNDDFTTGNFYSVKAMIKSRHNLYWQATLLYTRALKAYELCHSNLKTAAVYYELLKIFLIKGDFAKARQFGNLAAEFAALTADYQLKAAISSETGNLYFQYNLFSKSQECFHQAMEIYKNNNDIFGLINTYMKLGNIFVKTYEYNEALLVYQKISELAKEYGYLNMYHIVMNNLGITHSYLNNYQLAESYQKKYLKYVVSQNESSRTAGAYGNLALLFQKQEKWSAALLYFNKALKISRETGFKHYQSAYQLCCAEIYYDQHKYSKALKSAGSALNIALAISQSELIFHTRLIKIKTTWAIALQQFSEKQPAKLDIRGLNSLEELYKTSALKREKILAGFNLWSAIQDLNKILTTVEKGERCRLAGQISSLNPDLLTAALHKLLDTLPDNEKNSAEYLSYREALSQKKIF